MLRHLFRWQPAASIADDYEIKLNNGILGVQQPGVVGSMSYMTPLGRGVNRNKWDVRAAAPHYRVSSCARLRGGVSLRWVRGRSFPNFQTEAQQDLSTRDVNLLSSLSHWTVMNNAGLFTELFTVLKPPPLG